MTTTHPSSGAHPAQTLCINQHFPRGALYMVATPIGNLADITLRALHVLQTVDLVACEDTRHTRALLNAHGIATPPMLGIHQHNENASASDIINRLRQGQRIAYASDAGTPAISDPGARLVTAVQRAQFPVIPLPGASSLTAILSVAGIVNDGSFVFVGFLPSKTRERGAMLQMLANETRAIVLLEAPHRIASLAKDLASMGERPLTIGRELTKQFEEVATLSAQDLPAWLAQNDHRCRGEFTIVLHPHVQTTPPDDLRVLQILLPHLPLKTAVALASQITHEPKNKLYELALNCQTPTGTTARTRS